MTPTDPVRTDAVPDPWAGAEAAKRRRKRIWVPHVDAELRALWLRVEAARSRGDWDDDPAAETIARGVQELVARAVRAAYRLDPIPNRIVNWWRGTLVEQAYRNLHTARAQMIDIMTADELAAEIPGAVGRAHAELNRDDPRCLTQAELWAMPLARRRAVLRRLLEDVYESADMKHAAYRSFRNSILSAAIAVILLTGLTAAFTALHPTAIPLCFDAVDVTGTGQDTGADLLNCPTRGETSAPTGGDVVLVALIGMLGGTLATTLAIRQLSGSSGAYDVPLALAWLKVPLGAFTAMLGLVAVRGEFVPGLTQLDSQEQILAFALLLGFGQQIFTNALDRRARELVGDLPSKAQQVEVTRPDPVLGTRGTGTGTGTGEPVDLGTPVPTFTLPAATVPASGVATPGSGAAPTTSPPR
ncbi:hypothetical protein [Cellulomonas cellasea]|uniref:Uncharacterized protein n=1 Tax=Cellulomonas cellasea TaxID=43670 RepID=A0A7W4YBS8_9CELL|nr:hypothetical protein [Cellulomonas cellasea]MBB2923379.1 hypothetical protein [Cellulomonas cellasea]